MDKVTKTKETVTIMGIIVPIDPSRLAGGEMSPNPMVVSVVMVKYSESSADQPTEYVTSKHMIPTTTTKQPTARAKALIS